MGAGRRASFALVLAALALSSCGASKGTKAADAGTITVGTPAAGDTATSSSTATAAHTGAGKATSKSPGGDPAKATGAGARTGTGHSGGEGDKGDGGRSDDRARSHHHSPVVSKAHRRPHVSSGSAGASGGGGSSGGGSPSPAATGGSTFTVPTGDMEPTYPPEKVVTYNPADTTPTRGQVVVFQLPASAIQGSCGSRPEPGEPCQVSQPGNSGALAIGRVAALAGESISFNEGNAVVNGQLQSEPWMKQCEDIAVCTFQNPITVPSDSYYIVYDNRGELDDSRVWGALPQAGIVGTVEGS
jgi:signal peptidase I